MNATSCRDGLKKHYAKQNDTYIVLGTMHIYSCAMFQTCMSQEVSSSWGFCREVLMELYTKSVLELIRGSGCIIANMLNVVELSLQTPIFAIRILSQL